jgi:hypothetical protein
MRSEHLFAYTLHKKPICQTKPAKPCKGAKGVQYCMRSEHLRMLSRTRAYAVSSAYALSYARSTACVPSFCWHLRSTPAKRSLQGLQRHAQLPESPAPLMAKEPYTTPKEPCNTPTEAYKRAVERQKSPVMRQNRPTKAYTKVASYIP